MFKLGRFVGTLINWSFYGVFFYDGYRNIQDSKSIALDVIGIVLLLLAREVTNRIGAVYYGVEYIALKLNEESQKNNSVDTVFNDLTKDL